MGKKFVEEQPARILTMLEQSKARLVEEGFLPDRVDVDNLR